MTFKKYKNHEKAFEAVDALYKESIDYLCKKFETFSSGKIPKESDIVINSTKGVLYPKLSDKSIAIIKKICDAQKDKLNKITIWGDGTPIREWTYVEDAARVMLEYSNYDTEKNLTNIGVGKGISIKDLAHMICEESGYEGSIIYDNSKPNGAKCKIMNVVDNEFT